MFELEFNGDRRPCAEWGLVALSCQEFHATAGTFSLGFAVEDARELDLPFGYHDQIKIYRGAIDVAPTPWFKGWVVSTAQEGSPSGDGVAVELADVWHWLDALPYLQVYKSLVPGSPPTPPDDASEVEAEISSEDRWTSRVLLGADEDGELISVNAVLQEIIDYAVGEGVDILMGDMPSRDITIWATSVRDQMCGDILRDFLRWHPDVVAWIDHADGSLNLTSREDAVALNKSFDGTDDVASWSIRARPDLVPDAVELTYHITDEANNQQFLRIVRDVAPTSHDGRGPFVARASVELRGSSIQSQTQSIRCARIPGNSSVDINSNEAFEWFARHISELSHYDNTLIQFADVDAELVVDTLEHPKDPLTRDARTLTADVTRDDLQNELVDGSLDEWGGGKAGRVRITAKVGFSGGLPAFAALPQEQQDWFQAFTIGGVPYREVTVTVVGTSRRSGSRERLTSLTPPEPIPTGVAAHYYAATRELPYEGSVTLTAAEVGDERLLGRVLNINDSAWSDIKAQIQQVSYDLTSGTTQATFGPVPHLGLQDFSELGRMGRNNPPASTFKRSEPRISTGEISSGGYITPEPRVELSTKPGGGAAELHPWKLRLVGESWQVYGTGATIEKRWSGDLHAVTGLDAPLATEESSFYVYARSEYDSAYAVMGDFTVSVEYSALDRVVTVDGVQTELNVLIGAVVGGVAVQRLRDPLNLTLTCVAGVPAWVALLSEGLVP